MRQSIVLSIIVPIGGEAVNNFTLPSRDQKKLARLELDDLSRAAKLRLKWFDWHAAHGGNVSLTCRHFGIARQTFYRWQKRYDRWHLNSLEDRSSVPHQRRHRTWTTAQVLAVQGLREEYPGYGKDKLRVLLERVSIVLSASTIGRILGYLKRSGKLREANRHVHSRRRQWKRQYAVRKPRSYQAVHPGDIIQLDTMEVRPEPGVILKQFTSVDVVSR
jgi:putative transposase